MAAAAAVAGSLLLTVGCSSSSSSSGDYGGYVAIGYNSGKVKTLSFRT